MSAGQRAATMAHVTHVVTATLPGGAVLATWEGAATSHQDATTRARAAVAIARACCGRAPADRGARWARHRRQGHRRGAEEAKAFALQAARIAPRVTHVATGAPERTSLAS